MQFVTNYSFVSGNFILLSFVFVGISLSLFKLCPLMSHAEHMPYSSPVPGHHAKTWRHPQNWNYIMYRTVIGEGLSNMHSKYDELWLWDTWGDRDRVSQNILSKGFLKIFPQQLRFCKRNFTHLMCVCIYTILQNFIQLSLILTKLYQIRADRLVNFYISLEF